MVTVVMGKFTRQTASLLACSLLAWAQPAIGRPVAFTIQPGPAQTAIMDQGSQIVRSDLAASTVLMSTPQPAEENRVQITFLFVNKGSYPVNIGPENVFGSPITVVTYDQLMAEQRADEKREAFAAALGALGNSLSASANGGRQYGTQSYGGYVDCGIGCNATYRGTGSTQTYNPYLAQQAQQNAQAQNEANFAALRAQNALNRNAIAVNLRTTTVMPNQSLGGTLTFSIPRSMRKSKTSTSFTLTIRIGADVHLLNGYAGPIGAPPPVGASVSNISSSIVAPQAKVALALGSMTPAETYNAGLRHARGEGVPVNLSEAIRLYQIAAGQGYMLAQAALCSAYVDGTGVAQNDVEAAKYCRAAALQGNIVSQSVLGALYATGRGVEKNDREAARWLEAASKQGHALAPFNLGMLYLRGRGVVQSDIEAVRYFQMSADRGRPEGQFRLGWMYLNGRGVGQSDTDAFRFFKLASDQGNETSQLYVGWMYDVGRGTPASQTEAIRYYRLSADKGVAEAQFNLGLMYYHGRGVGTDQSEAIRLFRLAASGGFTKARDILNGLGQK